ncbi:unnamed protein product [Caenorhabditis bovis]|uniref:RRM domain-containing protein n=1 Tax=Caenorhabditis bovis TaxID=2654633 RepID=A0A8S1F698_9PELO|nr:unnamed protein product [Caenorhabditis bovis]
MERTELRLMVRQQALQDEGIDPSTYRFPSIPPSPKRTPSSRKMTARKIEALNASKTRAASAAAAAASGGANEKDSERSTPKTTEKVDDGVTKEENAEVKNDENKAKCANEMKLKISTEPELIINEVGNDDKDKDGDKNEDEEGDEDEEDEVEMASVDEAGDEEAKNEEEVAVVGDDEIVENTSGGHEENAPAAAAKEMKESSVERDERNESRATNATNETSGTNELKQHHQEGNEEEEEEDEEEEGQDEHEDVEQEEEMLDDPLNEPSEPQAQQKQEHQSKGQEQAIDKKACDSPAGSEDDVKSRSVWVRGLTTETSAASLKQLCMKYGKVQKAKIFNSRTKKGGEVTTCFGFVTFTEKAMSEKCVAEMGGTMVNEKAIVVERATESTLYDTAQKQVAANAAAAIPPKKEEKKSSPAMDTVRKSDEADKKRDPSKDRKEREEREKARRDRKPIVYSPSRKDESSTRRRIDSESKDSRSTQRRISAPSRSAYPSKMSTSSRGSRPPETLIIRARVTPPRVIRGVDRGISISTSSLRKSTYSKAPSTSRDPIASSSRHMERPRHSSSSSSSHRRGDVSRDSRDVLDRDIAEILKKRDEEHRQREEKLQLEREKERIRFEKEKLEKERLEIELMRQKIALEKASLKVNVDIPPVVDRYRAESRDHRRYEAPPVSSRQPTSVNMARSAASRRDEPRDSRRHEDPRDTRDIRRRADTSRRRPASPVSSHPRSKIHSDDRERDRERDRSTRRQADGASSSHRSPPRRDYAISSSSTSTRAAYSELDALSRAIPSYARTTTTATAPSSLLGSDYTAPLSYTSSNRYDAYSATSNPMPTWNGLTASGEVDMGNWATAPSGSRADWAGYGSTARSNTRGYDYR